MSFSAKCSHCGAEIMLEDNCSSMMIVCGQCKKTFQAGNTAAPVIQTIVLKPSGVSTAASTLGFLSLFLGPLTGVPAIICGIIGLCTARRGTGSIERSIVGIIAPILFMILNFFILSKLLQTM